MKKKQAGNISLAAVHAEIALKEKLEGLPLESLLTEFQISLFNPTTGYVETEYAWTAMIRQTGEEFWESGDTAKEAAINACIKMHEKLGAMPFRKLTAGGTQPTKCAQASQRVLEVILPASFDSENETIFDALDKGAEVGAVYMESRHELIGRIEVLTKQVGDLQKTKTQLQTKIREIAQSEGHASISHCVITLEDGTVHDFSGLLMIEVTTCQVPDD